MKKVFLSIAAVAALASCAQKSEVADLSLVREVSIVANAADTKTLLDGNNVVWENGDAIALRFANNSQYHVENFATTGSGASATFTGSLPNEVSVANGYQATGYAVYPAAAMAPNGTVSFTLPATVTALESGSFASGTNLSSAAVSLQDLNNSGTASATFKNAFSVVRFTLGSNVKSLVLTADGNIAGQATMAFNNEGRLVANSWTTSNKTLTVVPENSAFTSGKTYNVLVYPGTYSSLSVLLTDVNNCTYEKTVAGSYEFQPSKFYTFTFNTEFAKSYTFTATGRTFTVGDQIQTVFGALHAEVLAAAAGNKFTGNLPASVVEANTVGYALYPASAYSAGHISYNLDPSAPAELYSAKLTPTSESVAFNSVESALATVNFTVPAGVKSVRFVSDKGIVGATEMTVNEGVLVAGAGSGKEVTVSTPSAGTYSFKVYPVSGAALTVTLADAAGATVTKNVSLTVAAGQTQTLEISGDLTFDKNGSFANENFTSGGNYEF